MTYTEYIMWTEWTNYLSGQFCNILFGNDTGTASDNRIAEDLIREPRTSLNQGKLSLLLLVPCSRFPRDRLGVRTLASLYEGKVKEWNSRIVKRGRDLIVKLAQGAET
jgi:hypothetical protein